MCAGDLVRGSAAQQLVEPEGLGERPGLKWTAGGLVRRIAVADLGQVVEAGELGAGEQRIEEAGTGLAAGGGGGAADADPGLDERAGEPGPDRAVVVAAVALGSAAGVAAAVARVGGVERARAGRGPQHALDGVDHRAGTLAVDHGA